MAKFNTTDQDSSRQSVQDARQGIQDSASRQNMQDASSRQTLPPASGAPTGGAAPPLPPPPASAPGTAVESLAPAQVSGPAPVQSQPQPQVLVTLNDLNRALQLQAAQGIKTIDDFSERDFRRHEKSRPEGLPDEYNGVKLHYCGLDAANPAGHPFHDFCVPVSRQSLPTAPEGLFGVDGLVRTGGLLWFVMDQRIFDRLQRESKKLMDARVEGLNRDQDESELKRQGGLSMGIQTASPYSRD